MSGCIVVVIEGIIAARDHGLAGVWWVEVACRSGVNGRRDETKATRGGVKMRGVAEEGDRGTFHGGQPRHIYAPALLTACYLLSRDGERGATALHVQTHPTRRRSTLSRSPLHIVMEMGDPSAAVARSWC